MEEQLSLKLSVDPSQLDSFNRAVAEALATVKTAFGNASSNLTDDAKAAISQFSKLETTGEKAVDGIGDSLKALKSSFESSARAMDTLTNKLAGLKDFQVYVSVDNSDISRTSDFIADLVSDVKRSNEQMSASFDAFAGVMKSSVKQGTGSAKQDITELSSVIRTELLSSFQAMSEESGQATKSVGNKVTAMSRDIRAAMKTEIGAAAEQMSSSINKMTKDIAESLAGVSTSIAEAATAFKALAPAVASATNESGQELDQLATKNKEVNRQLLAEARFMAKTLSAQTRETIAAQKALFAGLDPAGLQQKFAPSALNNSLKLDLTQILEPTAKGELGSKFEDLWTEMKGEFAKFEKKVQAEEARIGSNRASLVNQKLKEIGDTEKAVMQTRAALVEQKVKEIGETEKAVLATRAAIVEQKMKEIGQREADAVEFRKAIVEQKLKEIAETEQAVAATRASLVEQKLKEIGEAERAVLDTRSALVEQKLREIGQQEKAAVETRTALVEQKLKEIGETEKAVADTRASLLEQKLKEIAQIERQALETRTALVEQKLKEIADAERALANTRASLLEQKLREIGLAEQQAVDFRVAMVNQKLQEIGTSERALADTRAALVEQKLKEIAQTESQVMATRAALVEQKLSEIVQAEKNAANTRAALVEQKLRQIAADEQALAEFQRAISDQKLREIAENDRRIIAQAKSFGRAKVEIEKENARKALEARLAMDAGLGRDVAVREFGGDIVNVASLSNAEALRNRLESLDGSSKKLSKSFGDLHSAARGVASGFNAMWLTWGNIGPLLAGAAISNAFVQAAKQGAALNRELDFIRVLGGESEQTIGKLKGTLIALGQEGLAGPQEVAEAMKTLALAGLGAQEQMLVIRDTLNLATVGALDLKDAAEAMVGIGTAFGIGFENLGRVGDVISKAASLSQASVESIKNSMATASVVAEQYGLSLEDTATALTILAKRNITGTAAGTALRNMLNELSGASNLSRKALEQLGFKALDANGKFKPLEQIITELSGKLKNYNGESFQRFLKDISNERGGKALSALLVEINKVTNEGGKNVTNFRKIFNELTESYGFNAIAAAELSTTTEKEFKKVKNALDTALLKSFDRVEPELRSIAFELRKTFASDEFKQALDSLVVGLGQFILILVESKQAILNVAIAYGIFKGVMISKGIFDAANKGVGGFIGGLADMKKQLAAAKVATLAQATANGTAAGSFAALGTAASTTGKALLRFLPGIGTLLWIGVEAWDAYGNSAKRALDAANGAKNSKFNSIEEYYQNEIASIREKRKILDEQKNGAPEGRDLDNLSEMEVARKKELADLKEKFEANRKAASYEGNLTIEKLNSARQVKRLEAEYAQQVENTNKQFDQRKGKLQGYIDTLVSETKALDLQSKKNKPKDPEPGTQTYQEDGGPDGARSANVLKQALDEQIRRTKELADRELNVLREKNRGKLVSDLEYFSESEKINRKVEDATVNLIEQEIAATSENSRLQGEARKEALNALELKLEAAKTERAYRRELEETKKAADENLRVTAVQAKLDEQRAKTLDELASLQEDFDQQSLPRDELARLQIRQKFSKEYATSIAEQQKAVATLQKELEDYYASGKELSEEELLNEAAKITARLANVDAIILQRDELAKLAIFQQQERDRLKNDPAFAAKQAVNDYYRNLETTGEITNRVVGQSIKQLEDAIVDAVATGKVNIKSLFQNLKDEVRRAAVQQIIMPKIRVAIEAFVTGIAGNASALGGAAVGLGAGGFGGDLGALAAISAGTKGNVFDMSGEAFSNAAGKFVNSGMGQKFGLSFEGFDGSLGSELTAAGQDFLAASQAIGKVAPYLGSIVTAFDDPLAGAGQAAGTYFGNALGGPLGAYIGGQIGKIAGETLNKVLGISGGEDRAGGTYRLQDGKTTFTHGPSGGQFAADEVTSLTDQTIQKINQSLKSLGSTSYITGFVSGLETSGKGRGGVLAGGTLSSGATFGEDGSGSNYAGTYYESTSAQTVGAEDAFKLYVQDLNQAFLQALSAESQLANSGIKENVKGYLANLGNIELLTVDQVQAAMNTLEVLNQVNTNFGAMKSNLAGLANASIETLQAFFTLSGGIEGLSQGLSAFMQTFYSEQERADISTQNAVKALKNFESAGLDMSKVVDDSGKFLQGARSELRKFTEGLDLTTKTGYEAYLGMLGLSQALGTVLPAFEELTEAVAAADEFADEIARLRIQLLELSGDSQAASAALRALETEGMNPAQVSSYDLVDSLKAQVAAAERVKEVEQERLGLESRLLQAQGNTVELRNRELEALDPSNRALLAQIFAIEDAKAAQDKYNQSLSDAKTAFESAQSAVESAQSKVQSAQDKIKSIQEKATGEYLSAQEAVASAQERILDLQREVTEAYRNQAKAIKEYLLNLSTTDVGGKDPVQSREALLARLRQEANKAITGNDSQAAANAQGFAERFLEASKENAGSLDTYLADVNTVRSLLTDVANNAQNLPAPVETDPLTLATQELVKAQTNLAEALAQANSINAPLVATQESLAAEYSAAQAELATAVAELAAASGKLTQAQISLQALEDIKTAIENLGDSLTVELSITAKSEIKKLIEFIANTDNLPEDLKTLALAQTNAIDKTVNYIVGSELPNDLKQLALSTSTTLVRTVDAILKSDINNEAKSLALAQNSAVQRTVDAVLAAGISNDAKAIALKTSDSLTRILNLALGTSDPTAQAAILKASDSLTRSLNIILGSTVNEDAKKIALAANDSVTRTIQAALSSGTSQGLIDLINNGALNRNVVLNGILASSVPANIQTLMLNAQSSADRAVIVSASLGSAISEDARKILDAQSATIYQTLQQAISTGALNEDQRKILYKASETIQQSLVQAVYTPNLTDDQRALLNAASGAANGTLNITGAVLFDPNDPLKSVFAAIEANTKTLADAFSISGSGFGAEVYNMAKRSAGEGLHVRPPSGGDPFNFNLNDIRAGIGNSIFVVTTQTQSGGSTSSATTSGGSTGSTSTSGGSTGSTYTSGGSTVTQPIGSGASQFANWGGFFDGEPGRGILKSVERMVNDLYDQSGLGNFKGDSAFQSWINFGGSVGQTALVTEWNRAQAASYRASPALYFAQGGLITGSGTGTSDSINAWVSNREFVMQRSAVDKFGVNFMDSINAGKTPVAPVPVGVPTPVAQRSAGASAAQEALLRAILLELAKGNQNNSAENRAMIANTAKTAKILDDVTEGGNAVITVPEETM